MGWCSACCNVWRLPKRTPYYAPVSYIGGKKWVCHVLRANFLPRGNRGNPNRDLVSAPALESLWERTCKTDPGYTPVSELTTEARSTFISKTYSHVAGAILLFTVIEMYLFNRGLVVPLSEWILSFNWLIIIGALMLVGWLATHVAHQVESKPLQYLALAGFVVAQAVIFAPCSDRGDNQPGIIESAVWITLLGTGGLTAVAFITRKDFSFMRGI